MVQIWSGDMGTLKDNLSRLEEIEEIIINKDNAIIIDDSIYEICDTSIMTTKALARINFLLITYLIKELLFQLDNQPCEICLSNRGIVLHYIHRLNNESLWLEIDCINRARLIIVSDSTCKFENLFSSDIKEEIEVSLAKIDTINKIINEFLK